MAIPDTASRVPENTAPSVNERIRQETLERLEACAGRPHEIERRLREIEREWDIERTIEANAATLALAGTLLGATVNRRFLILPAIVTGFLLQHAIQGWCPPVPVLRRLGFRTQREIDNERTVLKALRGDFRGIDKPESEAQSADGVRQALGAAESR